MMGESIPTIGFEEASQELLSSSYNASPLYHSSMMRTHSSVKEHTQPPGGLSTMLTDLPPSVLSLLLNIILIFLTIYLSNASDYLRDIVHKVGYRSSRVSAATIRQALVPNRLISCGFPGCVCVGVVLMSLPSPPRAGPLSSINFCVCAGRDVHT